jgi:hypothetical protein
MNKIKVEITMHNEETLWGYVFSQKDFDQCRLQDVMNDSRNFIPVHLLQERRGRKVDVTYKMTMINKKYIKKIEEIRE